MSKWKSVAIPIGVVIVVALGVLTAVALSHHKSTKKVAVPVVSTTLATTSSSSATTATTATTALSQTKVIVFNPWNSDGTVSSSLNVTAHLTGTCFATSIALPNNPNAYRCNSNNSLLDPCIASPAGNSQQLVCAVNPWSGVQLMTYSGALPDNGGDGTGTDATRPWAMELDNGAKCTVLTGTTATVGGLDFPYACDTLNSYATSPKIAQPYTVMYTTNLSSTGSQQSVVQEWT